jgi:hypothetical protein
VSGASGAPAVAADTLSLPKDRRLLMELGMLLRNTARYEIAAPEVWSAVSKDAWVLYVDLIWGDTDPETARVRLRELEERAP